MAVRGRIWQNDEPTPRTPTADEIEKAGSPLEYGRIYGYSEDDIAHFYNFRRRAEWVRGIRRGPEERHCGSALGLHTDARPNYPRRQRADDSS
jgi:hypothetical protein